MGHSDDVREYCKLAVVDPARRCGEVEVAIRAGDVHKLLGFKNRLPLVCAALGAKKFEEIARVERVGVTGPGNSTTTVYTFRILGL